MFHWGLPRKATFLIAISVILVIGLGIFGYLFKTGKIKIGADTLIGGVQTYTISGQSIDPKTNLPIANASIIISASGIDPIATTTDVNGNYRLEINIAPETQLNIS